MRKLFDLASVTKVTATLPAVLRLADLGANSVDRAEIAMLVQESIGLAVPRVELFGPANIGELADLFLKKLDAA